MSSRYIFISMFSIFSLFVRGIEPDKISFQTINSNSGLSSDNLTDLIEDNTGFIWVTSNNGINKYDGYEVKVFIPGIENNISFNTMNFRCLEEDHKGKIWFGSYSGGINILDKATGNIYIIDDTGEGCKKISDNHVNDLFCDSRGRMWIATEGGINYFDPKDKQIKDPNDFFSGGKKLPTMNSIRIFENSKGNILIGSWGKGLFILDETGKTFHQIVFKHDDPLSLSPNRIWEILEDKKGTYWISAWETGLHNIRINNDFSWEYIKNINKEQNIPGSSKLSSNIIYSLYEDPKGVLWAGTPYGVNLIMNPQNNHPLIHVFQAGGKEGNLSHNDIKKIHADRSGIIWLATGGGGINKFDPSQMSFPHYTLPATDKYTTPQIVRSFNIIDDSLLLLGANGIGFGKYSLKNRSFTQYINMEEFETLPKDINSIVCMHTDSKGKLWLGSRYFGLFVVNLKNKSCQRFLCENSPEGDQKRHINAICEDRFQNIWIGNESGLYRFIPDSNQSTFHIQHFKHRLNDTCSLPGNFINAILEDSRGDIWVGTKGSGICRFHNSNSLVEPVFRYFKSSAQKKGSLRSNFINSIYEDSKQRIWVGTGTAGIALYNNTSQSFFHIFEKDGLSSNVVFDIIEEDGQLWITTNKGLTKVIWKGYSSSDYEIFTFEDGLQGNVFIKGALFKDKNNRIFAGGYHGFNVFNPSELRTNTYIPSLAITHLRINGKEKNINQFTHHFNKLSHNKNNFTIEFSALSHIQPKKNKYAYILDGFEQEWHHVNYNRRIASYTNIPCGDYTFRLLASNSSGIWTNQPLEFSFRIKAHPANSWWAISLYSILLLSIIGIIYHFQLKNIKIQQALEIEKIERRKEEKVTQFKFRFFTNISHELLTPLSVINTAMEDLPGKITEDNGILKIMQNNTARLMHLVSQLLDFRKVENKTMSLQVSPGDINDFLSRIIDYLYPLANKKSIRVSLTGKVIKKIYFDHDKLDKTISNLLTNALRYTPDNGEINLSYGIFTRDDSEWLQIEVVDSGPGISKEMSKNVFDRFYQVKSVTGKTFGAGIGLALSRNLTEIHKGEINVENTDKPGAKFVVRIPVAKEMYNKKELLDTNISYKSKNYIIDLDRPSLDPREMEIEKERSSISRNKKILIVEDNVDFRILLRNHLDNYYEVKEAENGKVAYNMCSDFQPDMIISDLMMPEMNGIELCNKIKSEFDTSHIILILLTAKTDEETRFQSYRADADSYINKPVDIRTLHTRIHSLFKERDNLLNQFNAGSLHKNTIKITSIDEEFLNKAKKLIEDKITNSELNVMALSRELGTSTSMLYRKFTNLTGKSPVEYIRFIRLHNAARLLNDSSVNVSEAAYSSGFNDMSYFSKCFKKEFGISPKQYSKQHKSGI